QFLPMKASAHPSILLSFRERASRNPRRIALADALDPRVLQAAHYLASKRIAIPVLIADRSVAMEAGRIVNVTLDGCEYVDPGGGSRQAAYSDELLRLRKAKGMTT